MMKGGGSGGGVVFGWGKDETGQQTMELRLYRFDD